MKQPTPRALALANGDPTYSTGKPCKRGHPGIYSTKRRVCVHCDAEDRASRVRNPEHEKARHKAWREANPDKVREDKRAWRAQRSEEQKQRDRAAARRREKARTERRRKERERLRDQTNPGWRNALDTARFLAVLDADIREVNAARREMARIDKVLGYKTPKRRAYERDKNKRRKHLYRAGQRNGATIAQVNGIRARQGGRCAYCGALPTRGKPLHLDHKIPIARGGRHDLDNIQWLCAFHNMSKHAQTDEEYRQANGIPSITEWDDLIGA